MRAAIAFRGREMTHRELGAKILKRLSEDLTDLADVEVAPKMEGYQMFTIFVPKKARPEVKKQQAPKAEAAAAPAKKERTERQKLETVKPEPQDEDDIF